MRLSFQVGNLDDRSLVNYIRIRQSGKSLNDGYVIRSKWL